MNNFTVYIIISLYNGGGDLWYVLYPKKINAGVSN